MQIKGKPKVICQKRTDKMFKPQQVIIEEKALAYPKGIALQKHFMSEKIPITYSKSGKVTLEGDSLHEKYKHGKSTLVIGVKKPGKFQSCKPSAHYQLPLVSGCIGMCEYCYLNTTMGKRPYTKIYVNTEEILARADEYITERLPQVTIFEGAATSDPLPLEPYSHAISEAIVHFGQTPHGRFRFVSKYTDVANLLQLPHNGHTEIRFSVNIDAITQNYEHRTPPADLRIEAAKKVAQAGYPTGILIAPVFWEPRYQDAYRELIQKLGEALGEYDVTLEIISHRFTPTAKNNILEIFPETTLPMDEEQRTYKYGQFGYGKYIYPKEEMSTLQNFFKEELSHYFKPENILYII